TQTETCRSDALRVSGFACFGPAKASTLAASLRQPGVERWPSQPLRSAHWIWLNGSGGMVPSRLTCTRVSADRAVSASARTHCDFAASADHKTTTAAAPL